MKIFIIIYYLGHVGGVIGPVSYDMTECDNRVEEMNMEVYNRSVKDGLDPNILVYKCEARTKAPELEVK